MEESCKCLGCDDSKSTGSTVATCLYKDCYNVSIMKWQIK